MRKVNFLKSLLVSTILISTPAASTSEKTQDISGKYKSDDGVLIHIEIKGDNRYAITSDHSAKKEEAGHNWNGIGMLSNGKFIGLFKYPDDDTKYQGFFGIQEGVIDGDCLIIKGSQYKETLTLEGLLGPFKYCKTTS